MLKTQAFFRMYLCSQFPRLFVVVLGIFSIYGLSEVSWSLFYHHDLPFSYFLGEFQILPGIIC